MKGISAQPNLPVGGLFQQFSGCDPFEQGGLALPSLTPATQALSNTPKILTNFNSGGNGYVYAHCATKLYQVLNTSPYTVTDVTSNITVRTDIKNAIVWKGYYIYANTDAGFPDIRSNTLPVSGTDTQINAGPWQSSDFDFAPMCVGADGNLYVGNYGRVNEMTTPTGTSGNTTYFIIDNGFTVRDLVNDGRYLVIVADNNTISLGSAQPGKYQCRVYFWDMVQTDGSGRIIADAVWDINDSYLIAAKLLDNVVYVIGYNGLYVCNVATSPKFLRAFPLTANFYFGRPLNSRQVTVNKGSIYWVDGSLPGSAGIMAYGNPITGQPKIFYQPYLKTGASLATCLSVAGNKFICGDSAPELQFFNTGSSRGTVTVLSLDTNMVQPHRYDATKVVLGQPLASGQSVTCQVYCQNHSQLISTETKVFNSANPKQNLIFKPVRTSTNQPDKFEDIDIQVTSTGAAIQRVSVYATPLGDLTEDI